MHINAFWEKATIIPHFSWEKWSQQWKLALLAEKGIQLEVLLNGSPPGVKYPPEPECEKPVQNHTQATEHDRNIRNQQLKVTWRNRCKKINENGILYADKPCNIFNQKAPSLLYLCIETEGRRIIKNKHSDFFIKKEPMK